MNLQEAEAAFAAGVDAGDVEAIMRASDVIDEFTRAEDAPAPNLLGGALWFAEHGVPVFPLGVKSKKPMIPKHRGGNGVLDATTDRDQIITWWTGCPLANVGLATGFRFDAIDIDGAEGQRSRLEHWDAIFSRIDADAIAKVLTPRLGGMHIYVPPTGEGNAQGIVPGVDVRGKGGYVVAPPSISVEGRYRFLGTPRL